MQTLLASLGKIYLASALVVSCAGLSAPVAHAYRAAPTLPLPAVHELAQKCAPQVSWDTLAALVKTESSFHPWAIAVVGGPSFYPQSLAQAQQLMAQLSAQGKSFSVGLGQVNSQHFAPLGLSGPELLDPCLNLQVSASILATCYRSAQMELSTANSSSDSKEQFSPQMMALALQGALSCYFSGNSSYGVTSGYVARVKANLLPPQASHFVPSLHLLSELSRSEHSSSAQPVVNSAAFVAVSSDQAELWSDDRSTPDSSSLMWRDHSQPLKWGSR